MTQWIADHGVKAPGGIFTILTAAERPHVPTQQRGRINFPGLLLWLLLVAGSVGITLSVAEHCRGAVRQAFAPVAEETPNP